ncbi:hypothetical protein PR202_gb02362 [Eleusine coracana subsp. coracana]|uniref:F-box/LRR-repeat protein 15/At3g58940/PEG3-like LRR domain-containing protein n=1 Tax=Eleusine coracana subsp. coracana TaxID=191504 RepID=A0AAV5DYU9_ELECO|nr:hypothetical protein PR202_gb02362 [Eleusine coracana subsp. coracana]
MLERLSVSGCYFDLTDLISRCPRLRVLRVDHISGYPDYFEVRVHSNTLRELHVDRLEMHINIKAPLLERLSLSFSGSYMYFHPSDFPCLRSLCLHGWTHPRPNVDLRIRSTMIEKIVLHGMEIISNIYVDAPSLKILTLEHVDVRSPICIVAPMLKMFTLRLEKGSNAKMSLSAPALGNLLWDCVLFGPWMWFFEELSLWMEEGVYMLSLHIRLEHSGPAPTNIQENLPNVSVLKLLLYTNRHAYGTTVSRILEIFSKIQRLHLNIKRKLFQRYDGICQPKCSCGQLSWRDKNISLIALEAVEIENFEGKCFEVDLLKLLFRCAPLMKQVTLKACPDMLPSVRACKEISDLFKSHPSVKFNVYDSCGDRYCKQACVASLLRTAASLGPLEFIFKARASYISVQVPNFHRAESITLEVLERNQLELDTAGDFPMLERLSVSGCYFDLTDLISRCPRLRVLRVDHISGYPDYFEVRVHSNTLRELHVDRLEMHINIKAPLLERLSLSFSGSYMYFHPSDFPCLRSLCLHGWTHPRPNVDLRIRSTMIEKIVLHGMEIISNIYVDAPSLKILTLEHVDVRSPICIVAPMLKMFTLRLEKGSNAKMSLSAPALGNLLWDCVLFGPWMWFFEELSLWMEEGVYMLSLHIRLEVRLRTLDQLQQTSKRTFPTFLS